MASSTTSPQPPSASDSELVRVSGLPRVDRDPDPVQIVKENEHAPDTLGGSMTLFSLPRELRDLIWIYALQEDDFELHETGHGMNYNDGNIGDEDQVSAILLRILGSEFRQMEELTRIKYRHMSIRSSTWLGWTEYRYHEVYWGREPMTRLLRVSKAINKEATELLYTKFNFHLYSSYHLPNETLVSFQKKLPSNVRGMIKSLTIHGWMEARYACYQKTTDFLQQICTVLPVISQVNLIVPQCDGASGCWLIKDASIDLSGRNDLPDTEVTQNALVYILGMLEPLKKIENVVVLLPLLFHDLCVELQALVKKRVESGEW